MLIAKDTPALASPPTLDVDGLEELRLLKRDYKINADEDEILRLLAGDSELFPVLDEAVAPLKAAFGEDLSLEIQVQIRDDGDVATRVAPQLPLTSAGQAERLLDLFDRKWWLQNCHRSSQRSHSFLTTKFRMPFSWRGFLIVAND